MWMTQLDPDDRKKADFYGFKYKLSKEFGLARVTVERFCKELGVTFTDQLVPVAIDGDYVDAGGKQGIHVIIAVKVTEKSGAIMGWLFAGEMHGAKRDVKTLAKSESLKVYLQEREAMKHE